MKIRDLTQIPKIEGKRVLVRVDFNVPIRNGIICDDQRIRRVLPTINYLINHQAKLILVSHLGRPKKSWNKEYSLLPVVKYFSRFINREYLLIDRLEDLKPPQNKFIYFLPTDFRKNGVIISKTLNEKGILFLENIRFYSEEKENDLNFSRQLADLGDYFVMEAFGTAHRENSSVSGVTRYLSSYAGFLVREEVENLTKIISEPERPLVAILGGAKIATKIGVINNLLKKADYLLLGGAIANSFLALKGYLKGKAKKFTELNLRNVKLPDITDHKLKYPMDLITSDKDDESGVISYRALAQVKEKEFILDIGHDTIEIYNSIIKTAKSIIWNGPMGKFEVPRFSRGTRKIAEAIINSQADQIVIGGGETVEAVDEYCQGLLKEDKNDGDIKKRCRLIFTSTGGGAMLKFLEGRELPGLKNLIEL